MLGRLRIKWNKWGGWEYGPCTKKNIKCWHSWKYEECRIGFSEDTFKYSHYTEYQKCSRCWLRRAKLVDEDRSEFTIDYSFLHTGFFTRYCACFYCNGAVLPTATIETFFKYHGICTDCLLEQQFIRVVYGACGGLYPDASEYRSLPIDWNLPDEKSYITSGYFHSELLPKIQERAKELEPYNILERRLNEQARI